MDQGPPNAPRALILERNKIVARRAARVLGAAGVEVTLAEAPGDLEARATGAALLFADAFDVEEVLAVLERHPDLRGVIWTAEPADRLFKHLAPARRLSNVLGRESFEALPRGFELLAVTRRLLGAPAPPMEAFLSWGATVWTRAPTTTSERDRAVEDVAKAVERAGAPRRVAEMMGELAHELLMNAMYDAPVDERGAPLFAQDRKAEIALPAHAVPVLRLGTDGLRLVLQVEDPFGRLTRTHVFGGIERALRGGEMDRSHGGAGLGMLKIYQSCAGLTFDVAAGRSTRVTALFELDLNLREFRQMARSIHFFEAGARTESERPR